MKEVFTHKDASISFKVVKIFGDSRMQRDASPASVSMLPMLLLLLVETTIVAEVFPHLGVGDYKQ
jgi:hypothetical protein